MMLTRLWLHGLSLQDHVRRQAGQLYRSVAHRMAQRWWQRVPFSVGACAHALVFYLMVRGWPVRRTNRRTARAGQRQLLGDRSIDCYDVTWQRKRAIETAMNHGNRDVLEMLARCGDELRALRNQAHDAHAKPVVFAPLHFTSDVAATVICGLAAQRPVHAVSIYSVHDFSPLIVDWLARREVIVHQIHPVDQPQRLRSAIKSVRKSGVGMIIYPDALPQLTEALTASRMPVRRATLFSRPGLLHSGLGEVAQLCGAVVLPFYLTWGDGGLKLRAFPAFAFDPTLMDACIEASLVESPGDWLLWHYPSLFYFNSASPGPP